MTPAKTTNRTRPTPPTPAPAPAARSVADSVAAVTAVATPEQIQAKKDAAAKAKADRFTKLAVARVNRAIKAIDAVSALGNRRSYAYDDEQATKVKTAITTATDKLQKAFDANGGAAAGFTL